MAHARGAGQGLERPLSCAVLMRLVVLLRGPHTRCQDPAPPASCASPDGMPASEAPACCACRTAGRPCPRYAPIHSHATHTPHCACPQDGPPGSQQYSMLPPAGAGRPGSYVPPSLRNRGTGERMADDPAARDRCACRPLRARVHGPRVPARVGWEARPWVAVWRASPPPPCRPRRTSAARAGACE